MYSKYFFSYAITQAVVLFFFLEIILNKKNKSPKKNK